MSSEASMVQPRVSQQHFRRACSKFATGITILTVDDEAGTPHGMTVNSFTSVSLDPPLVLVCVDQQTRLMDYLREGIVIGVNVLNEHQQKLSTKFARSAQDRFEGVDWERGPRLGAPILPDVLAALECVIVRVVEGGDHAICIAEARHVNWRDGQPLVYFNSGYRALETLAMGDKSANEKTDA
ncbi:MAG: flavin reductase family protein [Bryobacteraceae bacterium]